MPPGRSKSDTISARRDPVQLIIWGAALALGVAALVVDHRSAWPAARKTAGPFLTLALVIVIGALSDRIGLFRLMARSLIPEGAHPRVAFAAVLAFTAIVSGFVNLDVAVVVAIPVALRVAERDRLAGDWLVAAVALTANATSFLLPSSNLTNLLVLNRSPLRTWTYVRDSWVAWLAVAALTVTVLAVLLARRPHTQSHAITAPGGSARAVIDLAPMYIGVAAIRALVGSGLMLHGGFVQEVTWGSIVAAGVNNLPAAAAIRALGPSGRWAAVLAMAIGPNLVVTGSVATLICRRIARQGEVRLGMVSFSLVGVILVPLQILVAAAGLHVTGALP